MTIEYLSFICFVGRVHHSALSSSSFMKSSFLIQMIRWIRGSSRIEFFFSYSSSLEGSSLNGERLILNCSHLLLLFLLVELKVITYFWHTFFFYCFNLLCILHSSTVFSKPSSDLSSYLQIAWSRNKTSSVSLGKTLVV